MKSVVCVLAVMLLVFCEVHQLRADNWNRVDEQSKTRQKKISYQPEEETLKLGQVEDARIGDDQDGGGGYSNLESEELDRDREMNNDLKTTSLPMDSAKSARLSMDSLVKDMRSKAVNSAYQHMDVQQPIEQSAAEGRGAEHDHTEDHIRIAVKSKRRYEFVPVHFDRDDMKEPRMIEIASDAMPLRLHFKSQSAAIVVTQSHMSPPMKPVEETVTMDQPYRISHEVHKPIIQTVKEYIQPYRTVIQTLKPVIETISTVVPKDNDIQHQHQQPSARPPFGGISGSVKSGEWNPLGMSRRAPLKAPPPRPSPSQQLQGKFNSRHVYDSVKGSESRPRIQRRMQQDDSFRRQRQSARHGPQYGKMQFGSSELVYVPMLPKYVGRERNHNQKDNQQLGDYFAAKNRYRSEYNYNTERYNGGHMLEDEHGQFDRDVAESGRFETVHSQHYMQPAYMSEPPEPSMNEEFDSVTEDEGMGDKGQSVTANDEEHFDERPFARCGGFRCPVHLWSESPSF